MVIYPSLDDLWGQDKGDGIMDIFKRNQVLLSRRKMLGGVAALSLPGLIGCSEDTPDVAKETPAQDPKVTNPISRLKMATIGSSDLELIEEWYTEWIDYAVLERGNIPSALANSWGLANMAGRPYILMGPDGPSDVFLRAVQIDPVENYKALTTFGWNAFEIIVDDVYDLNNRLLDSPFDIIGPPKSLGGSIPTIHAMQVKGPDEEVIYFTTETGDRDKSTLPPPQSSVDRLFIVVVAGTDGSAIREFYQSQLAMEFGGAFDIPASVISKAQGLPLDQIYHLELVRGTERGSSIEIDEYPKSASERPQNPGQLPPGNAMVSFSCASLDAIKASFITPPIQDDGLAYGGYRSAVVRGIAGELIELIEEPRP